ncbi:MULTISPECIES: DUF2333 family protein [unclassified Methylophaga]|jgi:hypothetical protein|uniref:DUF2333 family protein n=1 Tax=unclassified Methylophaga TaxID=2629249 RepID=UPI000C96FEF0|nr:MULTISPECIES: DUF2333 family protein [unclassified Methylophaga]MAK68056.1 hypothetical protein [Methylophaga sp.]MAY16831.1 hypothetical protein [Methylophaga sp.]MBN46734.1 hypothetical protein [Methylophaga sp.]HAO23766.1 DUF2333 domain-containing protein [Methylophaga sp.]HCD04556.1 DUF2333 domain-containing protein [Methylophaga sp.]|tara:strand:- start:17809 stop:18873 length:1065 start_codon:yes stop_codon:yes gene_type:complete
MAANTFIQRTRQRWWNFIDSFRDPDSRRQISKALFVAIAIIVFLFIVIMIWWSSAPSAFDPKQNAVEIAAEKQHDLVTGYTSTATLITLANTLLDKPGGYLTNDVMPPSVWMDNMPNWEFGVLVQIRDYSRALRNDISRSQSQSAEDKDLIIAEPQFNFNSDSWLFPPTESEYRDGIKALESYLARLADEQRDEAQFYARADNLAAWLGIAEKRLGSLSQRLSASVGQARINTDLAGDPSAHQSTVTQNEKITKTPWLEIDDVFYEARGSIWAMIHLLKAAEHDFTDVLQKKNALISLRQIIRELEATQATVWSPIILNGSGFGLFANHSLVMASYVSRANAAMIDLRRLLEQG